MVTKDVQTLNLKFDQVMSQRSYGFLITKKLIFGFQILDLKFHFSASLKEDLVNNGYSLFADDVISKPQYAEEFIKSFQFSLVTTLSRF